jgi:hypothetical protein
MARPVRIQDFWSLSPPRFASGQHAAYFTWPPTPYRPAQSLISYPDEVFSSDKRAFADANDHRPAFGRDKIRIPIAETIRGTRRVATHFGA